MGKLLTDRYPILDISNDCILSKMGDCTLAFEVFKPAIFSLGEQDYELLHQAFVKAIRVLPEDTTLHLQDWFCIDRYSSAVVEESFLGTAGEKHFEGRQFYSHHAFLFITKKPRGRRPSSSAFSTLLRRRLVPKELMEIGKFHEFSDSVGQFVRILEDCGLVRLEGLKEARIKGDSERTGIIEQYFMLTMPDEIPLIRDLSFEQGIRVGDRLVEIFTIGDAMQMPGCCASRIDYAPYSSERTKFSIGLAAGMGLLLPCNHIYNQYIFIGNAQETLKKFEAKKLRLQSLANHSRENAVACEAVNGFLQEAIAEQRLPVKAHFNITIWTDQPQLIREIKKLVVSCMSQLGISPHHETVGAPQIWWAGIPGNAGDFPMNDSFDCFLENAVCFLAMEGNSYEGHRGIRFGERLRGRPVRIDLYNEPLERGLITGRGTFVLGSTGGGKSMFCNHLFRSLYDDGAHIVIVDIGGSYKGLCELVNGYYFTYTEATPIRFNPFYLGSGEILDTEKKESLKALLVTLWKQENENFNRSEYVALSNALQGYYARLARNSSIFPCFNSFYDYLKGEYAAELKNQRVKNRDFDIENFLYVLRPFYEGGEFDFLLNARDQLGILQQRFVVLELDNIKDHPILLPVISLLVMELAVAKMRKIPEPLKVFAIEEAWKAMMQAGMSEFMRYAWKTFRKLNGIPIAVSQEASDLESSPIIKDAIIGNSDIKVLMDMRKYVNKFDGLQSMLGMSEKGKTLLFSVNQDNEPGRKYREFYVEIGGQEMMVLRNELSLEEYYAYTTEPREKLKVMEYAKRYGSMQRGIEILVEEIRAAARQKDASGNEFSV